MKLDATEEDIAKVEEKLVEYDYRAHMIRGVERIVIGAIGENNRERLMASLELFPQVEKVVPIMSPYKLVSHTMKREKTLVDLGNGVVVGGEEIIVMAGPCAVENEEHLFEVAEKVAAAGAKVLRGGAFKPRTSPYISRGWRKRAWR